MRNPFLDFPEEGKMKVSLQTKAFILIIVVALILGASGVIIGSTFISRMVDNSYKNNSDQLAHTVAAVVDVQKVEKLKYNLLKIYHSIDEKCTVMIGAHRRLMPIWRIIPVSKISLNFRTSWSTCGVSKA